MTLFFNLYSVKQIFLTEKNDESYECVVSETRKCYITLRKKNFFQFFSPPVWGGGRFFFHSIMEHKKHVFTCLEISRNVISGIFLTIKKSLFLEKMEFPIVNNDLDFKMWKKFPFFSHSFVWKTHPEVRKSQKMTKKHIFCHFTSCNFFSYLDVTCEILQSFHHLWYFFIDE